MLHREGCICKSAKDGLLIKLSVSGCWGSRAEMDRKRKEEEMLSLT